MSRLKRHNGVPRQIDEPAHRLGPEERLVDRRQKDVATGAAQRGEQAQQRAATRPAGIEYRFVLCDLPTDNEDSETRQVERFRHMVDHRLTPEGNEGLVGPHARCLAARQDGTDRARHAP